MTVHNMVQVEDSLVALASTDDQPAGLILRSDDGGLSWSQFETPLPEAIDGFDVNPALRPGPDLVLAGSWLVSFRSTSVVDEFGSVGQQAVAVSDDLGTTWQLADLPAPAGTEPFVWTAAEVDDRLIPAGSSGHLATSRRRATRRKPSTRSSRPTTLRSGWAAIRCPGSTDWPRHSSMASRGPS